MIYFHSTRHGTIDLLKSLRCFCNANCVTDVTLRNMQSSLNIVCERNEIYANTKQSKNDRAASGNDRHEGRGKMRKKIFSSLVLFYPRLFPILYNFNFSNLAEDFRNKTDCS